MSEDFLTEVEAVNAIFGSKTLTADSQEDACVLKLPNRSISIRLRFPKEYPDLPPLLLGTAGARRSAKKGEALELFDSLRRILQAIFRPGEVVVFDLLQELEIAHPAEDTRSEDEGVDHSRGSPANIQGQLVKENTEGSPGLDSAPAWTLSEVVTEKKSVFIARCASVGSPDEAKLFVRHLLGHDKRVAKATHNITAWRIKGDGNTIYQDCDDDGETAAGSRVLHLMQLMDLWNTMVCVTRWYGGTHLGPDRFRIINAVARDAFKNAGYLTEQNTKGSKRK